MTKKETAKLVVHCSAVRPDQTSSAALIVGHRDLSHDRDCPCFDAVKEYADLSA